jgi:hypothetical protein
MQGMDRIVRLICCHHGTSSQQTEHALITLDMTRGASKHSQRDTPACGAWLRALHHQRLLLQLQLRMAQHHQHQLRLQRGCRARQLSVAACAASAACRRLLLLLQLLPLPPPWLHHLQ